MDGISIALIIINILLISGVFWARNQEKEEWNNGLCPDCNSIWKNFGVDSQGGRGVQMFVCSSYLDFLCS